MPITAKWRRVKAMICGVQGKRSVAGWVHTDAPGLLVHRSAYQGDPIEGQGELWTVSHRRSGLCLAHSFPGKSVAQNAALALAAKGNWDRPGKVIRGSKRMKALRTKIAEEYDGDFGGAPNIDPSEYAEELSA